MLTNCYGERAVSCLGGVLGSAGLVLSSAATSVYHLHATLGVLTGGEWECIMLGMGVLTDGE